MQSVRTVAVCTNNCAFCGPSTKQKISTGAAGCSRQPSCTLCGGKNVNVFFAARNIRALIFYRFINNVDCDTVLGSLLFVHKETTRVIELEGSAFLYFRLF